MYHILQMYSFALNRSISTVNPNTAEEKSFVN